MLNKKKIASIFHKHAPLLFKLSCDSLFILVFFFLLVLIAEGLLPGIVSTRLGLYKIVIILCANILFSLTLKNFYLPKAKHLTDSKKIIWSAFAVALILIFNSLFALPIILHLFIFAISGTIIFYIFKIFQEEM